MFEALFGHKEHKQSPLPEPTPERALAALMVRIAFSDSTYRASEIGVIDKILSTSFSLNAIQAAKLRADAEELERAAPGTEKFAEILRNEVSYEERLKLVEGLWGVVLADGQRLDVEEDALHAVEAALEISNADSQKLRQSLLG